MKESTTRFFSNSMKPNKSHANSRSKPEVSDGIKSLKTPKSTFFEHPKNTNNSTSVGTAHASGGADKRSRGGEGNTCGGRGRPRIKHNVIGHPRISQTAPSFLPLMFSYKAYGRSSDSFSQSSNNLLRSRVPNPFIEMVTQVALALKKKDDVTTSPVESCRSNVDCPAEVPATGVMVFNSTSDRKDGVTRVEPIKATEAVEVKGYRSELGLDDDEEEIEAFSQDSTTSESSRLLQTQLDMLRSLHRSKMENMARSVPPGRLLRQLGESGYLQHEYQPYARTPADGGPRLTHGSTSNLLFVL